MIFNWLRRTRQQNRLPVERARHDASTAAYAGDFDGVPRIQYDPHPNGVADPGEVVWAWVPFEEDHTRGKDRPVLIIGIDHGLLLGLMLTSKDHDRDLALEARHGRHWLDVGTGAWDARRRPSEVRLDRVLRLRPEAVRREGASLDRPTFDAVARGTLALRGH
jgi:PemK-like, MazF-like toxin of type II toxin-antitoxin system